MRKLSVFNSISLDGFFTDADGDMSWAHRDKPDPEFDAFVRGNAGSGGILVFGRITHDQMASFWPTPMAAEMMPEVAKGMNAASKLVFSRTLKKSNWSNTRVVNSDPVTEIRRLKSEPGPNLVVLGSGTIVSQLTAADLVDGIQLVVVPVILGKGRPLFSDVNDRISLTRTDSRAFPGGNVVLSYRPVNR